MKNKKFEQWLKAIDEIIEEYKQDTHKVSNCGMCNVVKDKCKQCILSIGRLHCVDMLTFQTPGVNLAISDNKNRILFYKTFKKELLIYKTRIDRNFMQGSKSYNKLKLDSIQEIAWNTELKMLCIKNINHGDNE